MNSETCDKQCFWVFWVLSSIYRSNDGQSSEGYVEGSLSRFKLVFAKVVKSVRNSNTTEVAIDFSEE